MAKKKEYSEFDQYIYGNAVRQEEIFAPLPDDSGEQREQEERRRAVERQIRRERERAKPFTMLQTGALIVAIAGVLFLCKDYINAQSDLTVSTKNISSLETEYQHLLSENNALKTKIDTSIDYDAIKTYAMEELGMDYPDKSQVITYDGVESEYVRQNDEIPKE